MLRKSNHTVNRGGWRFLPMIKARGSPAEFGETCSESPRSDRAALLFWMLGYAVLFLVYYPPIAGIEDEAGFVNQALVWSRGAISSEGAGLHELFDFTLVNGRHVAQRHPGRSLLALPFLLVGGV